MAPRKALVYIFLLIVIGIKIYVELIKSLNEQHPQFFFVKIKTNTHIIGGVKAPMRNETCTHAFCLVRV